MLLIREVTQNDLPALMDLSQQTGSGMTSLPAHEGVLQTKITNSIASFSGKIHLDEKTFLMVLEDTDAQKVIGTTAIYTGVGTGKKPIFSFKKSKLIKKCTLIERAEHFDILSLVNDLTGSTEFGTLFLDPDYRENANGAFLSRIRSLLLANDPTLFDETVVAHIRGFQEEDGECPFWRLLGQKFVGLSFEEALKLFATEDNRFLANLMPKYPIYTTLLAPEAVNVIGKPHPDSEPAMALLKSEGFSFANYCDPMDAGPTVSCDLPQIKTVRESACHRIGAIKPELSSVTRATESMISTTTISGFKAVRGHCELETDGSLSISPEVAERLQLSIGETARHIMFRPKSSPDETKQKGHAA